jgi:hypothetical protein
VHHPRRHDVEGAGVGEQLLDGCGVLRVQAPEHHVREAGQILEEHRGRRPQGLDLGTDQEWHVQRQTEVGGDDHPGLDRQPATGPRRDRAGVENLAAASKF